MTAPDSVASSAPSVGRRLPERWSEEQGRAAVVERAGGMCEAGCGRRGTNFAHRQRRSQGGAWSPVNGLWLDGSGTTGCHGVLTHDPALAAAGGWEVPSWADPADVPVWLSTPDGPGWWLLVIDDDPAAEGVRRHVRVPVDPVGRGLPVRPRLPWEAR